jgi:hypothetical protein
MRRCIYCGHRSRGRACQYHKDLLALDPHYSKGGFVDAALAVTLPGGPPFEKFSLNGSAR